MPEEVEFVAVTIVRRRTVIVCSVVGVSGDRPSAKIDPLGSQVDRALVRAEVGSCDCA
jgi:hypothetical protein